MPGALTNYAEKKVLDHLFGKAAFTMPATVYLALLTSDPTETGSITGEVNASGSAYARQPLTTAMTAADATAGSNSNASAITFPVATADWGNITHFAIMDALTGGNALLYAPTTTTRQILNGDQYVVAAGQLTSSVD